MAITKPIPNSNIPSLDETKGIIFICPVCKSKKGLQLPKSAINQAKGLTTISIAKGLICEHQFQVFVDKNYMIRGYQRVDFEFEKTESKEKKTLKDDDLFVSLIFEGNFVKYKPRQKDEDNRKYNSINKNRTLLEIYNEFWEFIDEDNKLFQEFLKKDSRRIK